MEATSMFCLVLGAAVGALISLFLLRKRLEAERSRYQQERTLGDQLRTDVASLTATVNARDQHLLESRESALRTEAGMREQLAGCVGALEAHRASASTELAATHAAREQAERREAALAVELRGRGREVEACETARAELAVRLEQCQREQHATLADLSEAKQAAATQAERLEQAHALRSELTACRAKLEALHGSLGDQQALVASLETQLREERRSAQERLENQKELRASMDEQFKGIAAQVLQANSEKFETQTKTRLGEMSEAIGNQVKALQEKVTQTHALDTRDRVELRSELKNMVEASKRIDADANQLARALKGDRRAQGAWGELILDRILEQCGLREGDEYVKQAAFVDDEAQRFRPDVIIKMPGKGSVVIDAKVSLTAYTEFTVAETDEATGDAMARHLLSVRAHIKNLADKDYWNLNGLSTAGDYVLMFFATESAFADALRHDPGLFEEGFKKHIILTSPSTLLATLKTIEHAWRVERQNQNAREIAEQTGRLYDKLCAFVDELKKVGMRLGQAQEAYGEAMGKLSTGRGNLVRQAERISRLGLKVKKALPAELVEAAFEGAEDEGLGLPALVAPRTLDGVPVDA